ncbi:MAG: flavodoxin family protein [Firmicutes bacterium HGW-Firmicutes-1]|jgi:multimeric flavodoxin WrbA|nr:MAG: flavodoxin family protein [Firmicutes bacterium HGW-Firmicutes-1]
MKVLVLMGSPRKKDGYHICEQMKDQLNQNEKVEFEYVFLKALNVEECRGCDQCFQKGEAYCPMQDDIKQLKEKLVHADGIIFVSPVYAYQVTGTFKKVIDRLAYLFHRPELVGKPALTVVTTGGGGSKAVTKYLKMTACGWGCNLVGKIEVISSMYFEDNEKNSFYRLKYYYKSTQKINTATMKFLATIKSNTLPSPSFYNIYMFNGLKSKTLTSQADYKFWESRGWLEANYYYEGKLNPLKRLFGYFLDCLIKSVWKNMLKE